MFQYSHFPLLRTDFKFDNAFSMVHWKAPVSVLALAAQILPCSEMATYL